MSTDHQPLAHRAELVPALRERVDRLALRAPPRDDAQRWQALELGGRRHLLARPITLTPYASVQPCSARCGFCSENLRLVDGDAAGARLRPPPDYFDGLQALLAQLRGLTLSWSLSGLEASDDPDWLLRLLRTLADAERDGITIEQRVLYSNGAGFAGARGDELVAALAAFGLSWIEFSRHHHDAAVNQRLMRFRPAVEVQHADAFERVLTQVARPLPRRLVCIVQRDGVASIEAMRDYLDWAHVLGVRTVVFRELSRLSSAHRANATARHVDAQRVRVDALASALFASPAGAASLQPLQLTEGYYFWNLVARWRDELDVIFESADYAVMQARHDSDRVYKLVYFADGQLCAGWQPGQQVLWRRAPATFLPPGSTHEAAHG